MLINKKVASMVRIVAHVKRIQLDSSVQLLRSFATKAKKYQRVVPDMIMTNTIVTNNSTHNDKTNDHSTMAHQ